MSVPWPVVRLGDVLTQVSRAEKVEPEKEYRLLGVRLDGQGPFLRETVTCATTAASKLFRVEEGDFIYSRLFACRGAFGVIAPELHGCFVSNEFPTFRADPKRIDVRFIRYWFRLPHVIARVDADCSGSTPLTRNRFNERYFVELEIPLPSLSEQRRLVMQIDGISEGIEGIGKLRQQQDVEMQRMLLAAFRRISDGAPQLPMGQVAPITRRPVSIDVLGFYPELGIRSFGNGTFHKPTLSGMEVGDKRIFKIEPGDLLFSNVFAWEGAIAVAKAVDAGRFGSHRYITCVPNPEVTTSRFLCFYFLTRPGLEEIGAASPGGALRNRTLGLSALEAIKVPVPPLIQQRWFETLLDEVEGLKALQAERVSALEPLLSAVISRAFQGELVCQPKFELTPPTSIFSDGDIAFRRAAALGYVINALDGDTHLGLTKGEKLLHLIEYHAKIDLGRRPERNSHGPVDYHALREAIAAGAERSWFVERKAKGRGGSEFCPGPEVAGALSVASTTFGERRSLVDALITLLRPLDTQQCEIVATLYAAWNDLLLAKKHPSDDDIVTEARESWHPDKLAIERSRWNKELRWMKSVALVPIGSGRPTLRHAQG